MFRLDQKRFNRQQNADGFLIKQQTPMTTLRGIKKGNKEKLRSEDTKTRARGAGVTRKRQAEHKTNSGKFAQQLGGHISRSELTPMFSARELSVGNVFSTHTRTHRSQHLFESTFDPGIRKHSQKTPSCCSALRAGARQRRRRCRLIFVGAHIGSRKFLPPFAGTAKNNPTHGDFGNSQKEIQNEKRKE